MHVRAGHQRRSVLSAGVLAFLILLFAGCGDETSTPSASSAPQETQLRSAPAVLAPELVGTWDTRKWLDRIRVTADRAHVRVLA